MARSKSVNFLSDASLHFDGANTKVFNETIKCSERVRIRAILWLNTNTKHQTMYHKLPIRMLQSRSFGLGEFLLVSLFCAPFIRYFNSKFASLIAVRPVFFLIDNFPVLKIVSNGFLFVAVCLFYGQIFCSFIARLFASQNYIDDDDDDVDGWHRLYVAFCLLVMIARVRNIENVPSCSFHSVSAE